MPPSLFRSRLPLLSRRILVMLALLPWLAIDPAHAQTELLSFDFTRADAAAGWQAVHDLAPLQFTPAGMVARITGSDPYLQGPPKDYPADTLLWLRVRLRSDQGGTAQVFYFNDSPTEPRSVRFEVPAAVWHEVTVPMPPLGPRHRLRIDPPGVAGTCVISSLAFEERTLFDPPAWPRPEPPVFGPDPVAVASGPLKLVHNRTQLGGFKLEVNGETAAIGHGSIRLAYLRNHQARWFDPQATGISAIQVQATNSQIHLHATWTDPDGAHWTHTQTFAASKSDGTIGVESTWMVDRDRELLYLPAFTLLPGVGTHGTHKNQGLLAGLEYLENEPSSSEADLEGPASWRLVPDSVKLTFPLMAIQAGNHYLGLAWEPQPELSAVHDSPDRQFHSGGHLFGLLFPGSDGANREERSLLPYRPGILRANEPWRMRATLIGGAGRSIIPAVQHYVRLQGWPSIPATAGAPQYFELAARGWLDSKIREHDRYRHAVWPGFNPQPAADAALWMLWLAQQPGAANLADRLLASANAALGQVNPVNYNTAQVGHNRYLLPALVFGAVPENAEAARHRGRSLLGRFQPDGSVHYSRRSDGPDYGRTHWAPDANGLTASLVFQLLEAAIFSGDPHLLETGLRHLRALDKFKDTVPRGAQTWEIPLHTPDILASAYLVHAYTLGYELTGDADLLEQARYWAWTGVPFVYLTEPTPKPVGIYGTIAVLGATAWQAPVWLGQPVQWCGLVYAEALNRLAAADPEGPWRQLANGIAAAGIQHTWPLDDPDRMGLLPDYYLLRLQRSEGPAINPATLLTPALRLFDRPAPYTFRMLRQTGWMVHAPGEMTAVVERPGVVAFTVNPWSTRPGWLLVNGLQRQPLVRINGRETPLDHPHQYEREKARLVLRLEGTSAIEIE
ncbi:MAG: hypothetical protein KJ072_04295 [Verrucomicrobia bacterium]|nr:hypothetical protein [Verrucomicrobiota bacterium]